MVSSMRQDAADNRYAIVTAARQLLLDEGPGVSMRTIAKAAKVGVATVTRHFPERIELLDAVSAQAVNDITKVVDDHAVEFTVDTRKAWRSTVHAIGNLRLAALAQAIFMDSMQDPGVGPERQGVVDKRAAELREIYGPPRAGEARQAVSGRPRSVGVSHIAWHCEPTAACSGTGPTGPRQAHTQVDRHTA